MRKLPKLATQRRYFTILGRQASKTRVRRSDTYSRLGLVSRGSSCLGGDAEMGCIPLFGGFVLLRTHAGGGWNCRNSKRRNSNGRTGDAHTRWHLVRGASAAGWGPARTGGGSTRLALTRQLESRTHAGIATGGRCGGCPPAQGRAGTARPPDGRGQLPVVGGQERRWAPVERGSGRRSAGTVASARWGRRRAGIAHAKWLYLPVADTLAGNAHARWHRYRGALRGVSPRTREGRNGPTVQKHTEKRFCPALP